MVPSEKTKLKDKARAFITVLTCTLMTALMTVNTVYAETVVDVGTTAAQKIYESVVKMATPVAAASIVVAFLFSMLSHNQKAVETSRTVIKNIAISYIVIVGLGYIFNWVKELVGSGGGMTWG